MDKEAVYIELRKIMSSEFKLDPDLISLDKRLDEDLDLDSLDLVDLIMSMEDYINKKIDPALFKDALIIQDLVDLLHPLWK